VKRTTARHAELAARLAKFPADWENARYAPLPCFLEVLILKDFKFFVLEVLILNDFKSFVSEVLIIKDFKSLFPEVLILVDLKPLRMNGMRKVEEFSEVLILNELGQAKCEFGGIFAWKIAREQGRRDDGRLLARRGERLGLSGPRGFRPPLRQIGTRRIARRQGAGSARIRG